MKWIKKIKSLFFCFAFVTTFVVFVTAAYISIFWGSVSLGVEILWQILFVSFLCSLGILIYPEREVSTRLSILITVLHYIEVNTVVMSCGIWFGWFYADNLPMVFGMLFIIALVFVLVSVIMWNRNKQIAARMNERLKEYQEME